ncbi:MAG TPA: ABC transporter substrate-binding protein [Solirubrobacteraceae bacterium]|nr:ABC transporter substrate-binding protein [Solirubrobacteraceae bacterium]
MSAVAPRSAIRAAALLAGALLAAVVVAACGSSHGSSAGDAAVTAKPVSLVLDFTPNAVHAGIYAALERGYDRDAGIDLHVIVPSQSTDSIRLLETGRADFAILDIHDLAIARERGQKIAGILPIVEEPLAAVIAAHAFRTPARLQGHTVGVTGDPSDTAVLDSVVRGSGGNPAKVKTITIGYDAVADLLAGRVDAATAFWNDEGVTLQRRRPGFHVFRVDRYGAPSYPELVVCASDSFLHAHPQLARALVRALSRGYGAVVGNPQVGIHALESQVPGLDPQLVAAELAKLEPAFTGSEHRFGVLDVPLLRRWARWEQRFGIVGHVPVVSTTFDTQFAPR